jgi:hypothetical protein
MHRFLFPLCSLIVAVASSAATPEVPPAATERVVEAVTLEYDYSSEEGLEHTGSAGSVAVHRWAFTTKADRTVSSLYTISYGVQIESNQLDATPGTYLPDRLMEVGLRLGISRPLSTNWNANLQLTPGIYGDGETIDGKSLNVPLLLGASYAKTRDLIWLFGIRANVRAEHPVLPVAGVRWQFAPDWSLHVAFPRSGVQWRTSSRLTLDAGATFQGGTFRITENLGTPTGAKGRLANTFMNYREIRVGLGADYALTSKLSVRLDGGAFVDRRFDYFDRDYRLDGEGGWFGAIRATARF